MKRRSQVSAEIRPARGFLHLRRAMQSCQRETWYTVSSMSSLFPSLWNFLGYRRPLDDHSNLLPSALPDKGHFPHSGSVKQVSAMPAQTRVSSVGPAPESNLPSTSILSRGTSAANDGSALKLTRFRTDSWIRSSTGRRRSNQPADPVKRVFRSLFFHVDGTRVVDSLGHAESRSSKLDINRLAAQCPHPSLLPLYWTPPLSESRRYLHHGRSA